MCELKYDCCHIPCFQDESHLIEMCELKSFRIACPSLLVQSHLIEMCELKYQNQNPWLGGTVSHLIEMCELKWWLWSGAAVYRVTSHRDVWVEILYSVKVSTPFLVTSHRDVWVEICIRIASGSWLMSHLIEMCELKWQLSSNMPRRCVSHLIEMCELKSMYENE